MPLSNLFPIFAIAKNLTSWTNRSTDVFFLNYQAKPSVRAGEVIDPAILERYAQEIRKVKDLGVEIAIVIGGGNIFRGAAAAKVGIDRVQGDYMGMLATVINAHGYSGFFRKTWNVYSFIDSHQNGCRMRTFHSSAEP